MLLRWQHDVLYILLDGDKGTSLDVVIPPVGYQMLDGSTGTGAELHFIEYNQGGCFPVRHLPWGKSLLEI